MVGSGGWGGGVGGSWGGGEDSFSLVFENSIVLIKCTLYDTVFQRQVSICRGVVFSYSFSIYCAAYHGIWCSVCKEIKISKSSGYSHLAARILKDSFLALTNQLVYLFTLSANTAIFPDDWKVATIIPLCKGGQESEVGNYRPVSLLPLPGKLLEKIVHSHISGYFEDNKLLTDYQGGFRKNKSTTSTIVSFTDAVLRSMNEAEITLATFVDLRKAFDTVNHRVLIRKLAHLGMEGKLIKWCRNYLANRMQSTVCNGRTSEARSNAEFLRVQS